MSEVGRKYDGGKAPIVQGCLWYFPRALQAVAEQSRYGKDKYNLDYADKNFMRVEEAFKRYSDGLGRHLAGEEVDFEGIDPESGLPHAYAVAWNALARLEILLTELSEQRPEQDVQRDKQ